jgi:N-acetylmuramoyl-L-alanine amidase
MRAVLWLFLSLLTCSGFAQVVCIDPGHPSEVGEGTRGKKLTELHANWIEALLLKDRLEKRGIKVVMTKHSEKEFVRNKARAETANNAHADLMVRLHCDSAVGSGFTCYYPAQKGTVNGVRGPSDEVMRSSKVKATAFHDAVAAALKGKVQDNGLKGDIATAVGHKQGALTGSIYSKVPVVLIEMVVLTNHHDEAYLSTAVGQGAMADALAEGVITALKAR